MSTKIAFIGLGVMGYPMAGHLAKVGFDVCVYNRTQATAQRWCSDNTGAHVSTPRAAAENADVVCICVGNDDDLRQVTLGEQGALAGCRPGAVILDHTTVSAKVTRELAELAAHQGVAWLDAPVSGGQAGAENGVLTVMLGGESSAYESVIPVLDAYSRFHKLLGPSGQGQLAKMMNQICIAGVVQGLAEALHFGQNAGLDCAAVVEVISQGAAQSWQMQNRYQTMLAGEYEHGFAVDWMRKDLQIALDAARENGSLLPLTALVDQFYGEVQKLGGGRWDTSSLLARLTH